ncbi:MAG: hypothetical protein ACOY3P_25675 [Planctomycetota bacterium]
MAIRYAIIETPSGMTVTPLEEGKSVEEVAARFSGLVVDAGPFSSYQDAYDALLALQDEEDEDDARY